MMMMPMSMKMMVLMSMSMLMPMRMRQEHVPDVSWTATSRSNEKRRERDSVMLNKITLKMFKTFSMKQTRGDECSWLQ